MGIRRWKDAASAKRADERSAVSHEQHQDPDEPNDTVRIDRDGLLAMRDEGAPVRWKYFIPHHWESDRTTWEDIWLLPEEPAYTEGKSIWLTVDAVSEDADPPVLLEEAYAANLEKLGTASYHVEGEDMVVRALDFDREELLGWARVWLEQHGLPCTELVEGQREDFAGTNQHARLIEQATRATDQRSFLTTEELKKLLEEDP